MRFGTLDEFVRHLTENDLHISDFKITNPKKELAEKLIIDDNVEDSIGSDDVVIVESVKILSLADAPDISYEVSDGDVNELRVTNVNVIKESCGAGDIMLKESKLSLNICDSGGSITTKMTLEINGSRFNNVPLTLVESATEHLVLSKSWLTNNL